MRVRRSPHDATSSLLSVHCHPWPQPHRAISSYLPATALSKSSLAYPCLCCLPLQALAQSSTSFRSTCPNHVNLPRFIISTTPSTPSLLLIYTLGTLSFNVTSHTHLNFLISLHPLFLLNPYCPGLTRINHHTLHTSPVYSTLLLQGYASSGQQRCKLLELAPCPSDSSTRRFSTASCCLLQC